MRRVIIAAQRRVVGRGFCFIKLKKVSLRSCAPPPPPAACKLVECVWAFFVAACGGGRRRSARGLREGMRGEGGKGEKGRKAVRYKLTLLSPPTAVAEMAAARLHAVGAWSGVGGRSPVALNAAAL